ncbi:MAG: acyl-phosphate glycerol 3-phosphate acyltransferase [Gammaproteobacteria bacterium RIFCSPHIGHO2_02_FULL_42_13]|nr:MAG: acyl-phosphate glycerol 3-phosphate acyltransferase [Gammaproteobacteria bacterium RIFCSPHIGHO2_02_FULL_42_13]OGT67703.1 MAG: acyl-phosphate glycerol 3-phosphate acyltransferase [Gammaproteobacteria bacterium RIFCSPLOWO2_02_FULL_42_9]
MLAIITIIAAYLIGSISSGVIISKYFKQIDPREAGSGSSGATNVLRLAGNKAALITLGLDVAKGIVAVSLARIFLITGLELGVVVLAVVAGHVYPVFFKFKGGKGVATAFGAILVVSPMLGIVAAVTWAVVAFIFHYSSLASLIATVLTPVYALFFAPVIYFLALIPVALLIIWTHWDNIARLRDRTEPKLSFTPQQ